MPYHDLPAYRIQKAFGFSFFPYETIPTAVSWVATTGNLVWTRIHETGGYFAALEKPEAYLKDVEDFIAQVWPKENPA
jgi:microsomal epoxide hydrolase